MTRVYSANFMSILISEISVSYIKQTLYNVSNYRFLFMAYLRTMSVAEAMFMQRNTLHLLNNEL